MEATLHQAPSDNINTYPVDEVKQKPLALPLADRSASPGFQALVKKIEAGEIDPKNLPPEYETRQDLINMMISTNKISINGVVLMSIMTSGSGSNWGRADSSLLNEECMLDHSLTTWAQ